LIGEVLELSSALPHPIHKKVIPTQALDTACGDISLRGAVLSSIMTKSTTL